MHIQNQQQMRLATHLLTYQYLHAITDRPAPLCSSLQHSESTGIPPPLSRRPGSSPPPPGLTV
jgi:hypothetical protein